ncbi:MAG: pyroglutamyl-peptidase I [Oscillospiraceae bacterium]|nr:pyroglutamyl-peptidase I [Oscillospiraceae bacterium]
MKHLIITGFDPFGGETVNPAWEAVKALPDALSGFRLTRLEIPTVFEKAARTVLAAAEADPADVILCVGQAGGRAAVTPERIAINLSDARIMDNEGNQPVEKPIDPEGPDGIFSTIPVSAMARAIREAGLPGQVSLSAGAFVCNDTLYRLLRHFDGTATHVGFIHVPYLPQQAKEGVPSMPLEQIIDGLKAAIWALES